MEKFTGVTTLLSFDAARGDITTTDGREVPMLRAILTVERQDKDGRHPAETWPDLWLEPHTAIALAEALKTALAKYVPEASEPPEPARTGPLN